MQYWGKCCILYPVNFMAYHITFISLNLWSKLFLKIWIQIFKITLIRLFSSSDNKWLLSETSGFWMKPLNILREIERSKTHDLDSLLQSNNFEVFLIFLFFFSLLTKLIHDSNWRMNKNQVLFSWIQMDSYCDHEKGETVIAILHKSSSNFLRECVLWLTE